MEGKASATARATVSARLLAARFAARSQRDATYAALCFGRRVFCVVFGEGGGIAWRGQTGANIGKAEAIGDHIMLQRAPAAKVKKKGYFSRSITTMD